MIVIPLLPRKLTKPSSSGLDIIGKLLSECICISVSDTNEQQLSCLTYKWWPTNVQEAAEEMSRRQQSSSS
jgi:hypothetical protein